MQTMRINRVFEAAHRLPHVPATHKCFRIHGHSYGLEVACEAREGAAEVVDRLVAALDHRYLNELPGLDNATSEHIARWIWRRLADELMLESVRIDENADSACICRGLD